MPARKPWFLVMTPEEASKAGSQWVRASAASKSKVVARPIAPEGWITLMLFAGVLTIALLAIWLGLFLTGRVGVVAAVMLTIAANAIAITVFVLVVLSRMTTVPPGSGAGSSFTTSRN